MHDHDAGLGHDLELIRQHRLARRRALSLLGSAVIGGGLGTLLVPRAQAAGACVTYAAETAGPYPADGTNVAPGFTSNALTQIGIVRRDIRTSLNTTTRAPGAKLVLRLRLVDSNDGCTPLAGYAVYLWHCDRDGGYSLYTLPQESYLRGIQVSNEYGWLSFVTIFPGCYSGRYPHMHLEVFASLSAATSGSKSMLTSQLAMPADMCTTIYQRTAYATSRSNLARVSLESDGIFRDNSTAQVAAMTPTIWYDTEKRFHFGRARIGVPA